MKTMLLTALAAGAAVILAAGCVQFEYEGQTAPASGAKVTLVRELSPQIRESGKKLGKAVAWGNYQDVSRDKLEERLREEAAERGANTVLVLADQVVPAGTAVQVDPMVRTMETVSSNNTYSMNQLQQDFDGGYGKAELFGKNAPEKNSKTDLARDYTRIIRAEFLICDKPAKSGKPAAKPEVPVKK